MIPWIVTPHGNIPTFPIFITLGIVAFLLTVHISLRNTPERSNEESFIFPRLVIAGAFAWFFAGLFDSLFKFFEYGKFEWKGITFYGGLIGAALSMRILLIPVAGKQKTKISVKEWFQILTLPLVVFHFFGRLGCFFAGCCYGKITTSRIGVVFVDQLSQGIVHNGIKRYPTQLFEAALLLLIFIIILFVKDKVSVYLICYSIGRFFIEFFRGDDRGSFLRFLSPAQGISILFFALGIGLLIKNRFEIKQTHFSKRRKPSE